MYLYSSRNRKDKFTRGSMSSLFLMLVQINIVHLEGSMSSLFLKLVQINIYTKKKVKHPLIY